MKKILWLLLVLLLFAALFVFVYVNPFPAMMEVFSPLFGGGNVTIGGTKYPASSKSITAVISRWDMEELDRFTQLESADLRGSSCYQEIAAWADAHPEVSVDFDIPLANGSSFDSQAETLDLSWVDAEHLSETLGILRYAGNLRSLQLGEVGGERISLQDLVRIHELFPDLHLDFTAVIGGQKVDSSASSIDLSALSHEDAKAAAGTMHLHNGEYVSLHMQTGHSQYRELTKSETDKLLRKKNNNDELLSKEEEMIYGTGLSWQDYPSVNIRRYENDFSSGIATSEGRYRRDVFDKKVETALRLGIIECEENNNVYKYFMNLIPADWDNLDIRKYKTVKDGKFVRGKRLFDYLKEQNKHSTAVYRKQIMLYNSEAFGDSGFDFNEIIKREQWDQMVVDRTHRAYMKRILRKATGLYQDMEDTLYRYYEVEKILTDKEKPLAEGVRRQRFVEYLANGLVMTDEDQYEWTILTAEGRSGSQEEDLITFGRRTKMLLADFDKKLLQDGLLLSIVYRKYCELVEDKTLDDESLDELREKHITGMSEKEFDKLMDERIELLQNALDSYNKICGGSKKDPVDQFMDYYQYDDDMYDQSNEVCQLFETIKDVLPKLMV